jgi:crossover junction endodeoxyribonuclease RusA
MKSNHTLILSNAFWKPLAMIKLILPFPDNRLSPNGRRCWQAKQNAKMSARNAGYVAAQAYRGKVTGKTKISLTFYPKTKRRRDADNLLASSKNLIDGVATGLGCDDSLFMPITINIGKPDKLNPRTEMVIDE